MNMLLNAGPELARRIDRRVDMMTAGAPPPAAVIEGMERLGFRIAHVYSLTEGYGPATSAPGTTKRTGCRPQSAPG
jgi:fatty-acyl-CoA synthase